MHPFNFYLAVRTITGDSLEVYFGELPPWIVEKFMTILHLEWNLEFSTIYILHTGGPSEIPFKVQNRHELFNDPWRELSEIDLQRITSYGTYSQVEVKRMHLKCVGERAPKVCWYAIALTVTTRVHMPSKGRRRGS